MKAIHWINSTGGDFADGADWSGGVVPGAGDNAIIDASGTYRVTLASAETVQSLVLNDRGATVSLGNGANLTVGSSLTLKAGRFILGLGATISGGTLSAKRGKFLWQDGILNGVTYDGLLNMTHHHSALNVEGNGLVLTGANGTGPGTIDLGSSSSLTFLGTQTLDNATVNINGGDLAAREILTLGVNLTIDETGVGGSVFFGPTIVNEGVINAVSSGGLYVQSGVFTNQGAMTVSNGGQLNLRPSTFTNLVGGTLTGGNYEVDAGSTLELGASNAVKTVVADDAVITLSGAGSVIQGQNSTFQEIPIESTLATIGAAGTLNLLAGRNWISTNAMTNAGTLVLGGGTFAPSALTNDGVISGHGVIGVAVIDAGTIEAASGTLDLTQAVTGAGAMTVDAGAILKVESAASATLTTTFAGAGAVLGLGDAATFAATIVGFAAGDTIDVLLQTATSATLQAGDKLAVMNGTSTIATLQLSGNYTGDTFSVASDGHSGTNITVNAGLFAQAMSSMAGAPAGHAGHVPDASRIRSPMLASPRAMFA